MSHMTILDESNGNTLSLKSSPLAPSISTEDLSEYTDADESISAPTEYFAEFLSAIMTHDYRRALKYCKLILEFEPNNLTAKEFYPLILEKISYLAEQQQESETDENSNIEDFEVANSKSDSSFSDATEASSSDADFPSSNGSNEYCDEGRDEDIENIPSGNSYSDSTTHSYSSLLLEEEDDIIPALPKKNSLDVFNGNGTGVSCSDSESPTEPLTQRLAGFFKSSLNT
ncbi:glutamate-rich protein 2 [Lutzomyia longipalpis]|uniref:glutamate-rich protein 2 n=1 Tax=Lutzomyia longipalpis TaxID=7200 RepID=UPI00248423ED|nr:glutamate-rich protein 2 [Lutzomyia longipalpis]